MLFSIAFNKNGRYKNNNTLTFATNALSELINLFKNKI